MTKSNQLREAIELLQDLGLKEYEARCFVGLTRLDGGTAKQLGEVTEVPRTRVYDAIRVLEAHGLVEVRHSSPQQYRAVSIQEATETLRTQYESRVEQLGNALDGVDRVETEEEYPVQQIWSMSGRTGIETRTNDLIQAAETEVVLVVGDDSVFSDRLVESLRTIERDVELLVGAVRESLESEIREQVPEATTFTSGLEWLHGDVIEDEVAIGRLLLIDRSTMLVSSVKPESGDEQAVFCDGLENGMVVIARRLLGQGLMPKSVSAD